MVLLGWGRHLATKLSMQMPPLQVINDFLEQLDPSAGTHRPGLVATLLEASDHNLPHHLNQYREQ